MKVQKQLSEVKESKRCSKCGGTKPVSEFYRDKVSADGYYSWCKECKCRDVRRYNRTHPEEKRVWAQQYRAENKDKIAAYQRRYWKTHRDEFSTQKKDHYRENREYHLGVAKKYYREHREERLAYLAKYREEHAEEIKAKQREYYQLHGEDIRKQVAEYGRTAAGKATKRRASLNYRARKAQTECTLSDPEWADILTLFEYCCAYCGQPESRVGILHREHVVPVSTGGGYTVDNIVCACASCNTSKRNQDLQQWMKRKGYDYIAFLERWSGTYEDMESAQ